jgi:hypothetical protein
MTAQLFEPFARSKGRMNSEAESRYKLRQQPTQFRVIVDDQNLVLHSSCNRFAGSAGKTHGSDSPSSNRLNRCHGSTCQTILHAGSNAFVVYPNVVRRILSYHSRPSNVTFSGTAETASPMPAIVVQSGAMGGPSPVHGREHADTGQKRRQQYGAKTLPVCQCRKCEKGDHGPVPKQPKCQPHSDQCNGGLWDASEEMPAAASALIGFFAGVGRFR